MARSFVSSVSPRPDPPRRVNAATEQGDDYWYDAKSLLQFDMEAMKKLVQRPVQGQISKDRLKAEIAAPYKNNWLGLSVAAVAVIIWFVKNNPQLCKYEEGGVEYVVLFCCCLLLSSSSLLLLESL